MQPNTSEFIALRDGIAALRFYDISKLARGVKGAALGIDINRKFTKANGQPIKLQFADWCMANLDHAALAVELPQWEESSRQYYEGRREGKPAAAKPAMPQIENVPFPGPAKPQAPVATDALPEDLNAALIAILEQASEHAKAMDYGRQQAMTAHVKGYVDALQARIEQVAQQTARDIHVIVNHGGERVTQVTLGRQHKQFDMLLKLVALRNARGYGLNIWLTGPAGSGKSTAAINAAKALDCPFYFTGAINDEFKLLGFINAMGQTIRTAFREAWEHGGVFLFDEIDGSGAGALLALNAALANGTCDFPDGNIERHRDCVMIAAANTWGGGATHDYVGRSKLDAASVDRFVQLDWGYDEDLESSTCGNPAWASIVQTVRAKVQAQGIKVVVSPRASYDGATMLAGGIPVETVLTMAVRKGMTVDQWRQVEPARHTVIALEQAA